MPASPLADTIGTDAGAGGADADIILGLDGDDRLTGNAGDDSLDGGNGNDTLVGGPGADTLDGDAGEDSLRDGQGANLISGGAGDDSFSDVSGGDVAGTLIGGAGRDLFVLGAQLTNAIYYANMLPAADRVADFQAGAGGDLLDLRYVLSAPADWSAISLNPFVAGLLRFSQSGADALLQLNNAGAWLTLLVLGNTDATALTADNIVQNWNPCGPAGLTLTGDFAANLLSGLPDNDTIGGGGGPDTLSGLLGADSLVGDTGNDWLLGGDGADTLAGGDGRDTLSGGAGDDSLEGGVGGDHLMGEIGNDTLLGGAGDDTLGDALGSNLLDGGDGNDILTDISAGPGSVFTGGAGQDIFRLSDSVAVALTYGTPAVIPGQITDFAAGPGGDVFDFGSRLLATATGWTSGTNPFATGTLRAVQSGVDTLLQYDPDGPAGPGGWATLAVLRNVSALALGAGNFAAADMYGNQAFDTAGALAPPGIPIHLPGTTGADTLTGNIGSNSLAGQSGADSLVGGSGDDTLHGDDGDDTLDGGSGNDSLSGDAGSNSLIGGDGDDILRCGAGPDTLTGGSGNDDLYAIGGGSLAMGGDGDDTLTSTGDGSTLTGDAGQDVFGVWDPKFANPASPQPDVITDFATGPGGDELSTAALAIYSATSGLPPNVNPFAARYLRLIADGPDTLLQLDDDGPFGLDTWRTMVRLLNLDPAGFTATNILGGWNPFGTVGGAIAGTDRADSLTAGPDNDSLTGLYGDDTLAALGGDDLLAGGAGNDSLSGGDGADSLTGDTGADTLDGGAGNDSLAGATGNDSLTGGDGDDSLAGGDGDDNIALLAGNDTVDGGAGNDTITGIDLAAGTATIAGGSGADLFVLASDPGYGPAAWGTFGVATITDFTPGAGGERIDGFALLNAAQASGSWTATQNPFITGHLRLAQSGADTLLQLDRNGAATTSTWFTVLRLANTEASAFTADIFLPYVDASGIRTPWTPGAPIDVTRYGTAYDDSLTGTAGDDALAALSGNDTLDGAAGADTLLGGDGNDVLADTLGANSLDGGAGADTVDRVAGGDARSLLTGGAGPDRFVLASAPGFDPDNVRPDTITDFAAGAGGDLLDIGLLLLWSQINAGLDANTNPFRGGYLRLVQSGADTLLQLDRDGPAGSDGFVTVVTLRDVGLPSLTIDNFTPAWALDNNPAVQNGTSGGDTLAGAVTNGLVDGGGGNDSLIAGPGDATLSGGGGDDTLEAGSGADSLDGGDGDDLIIVPGLDFAIAAGGPGNDTLTLSGAGLALDLDALAPARLTGIEAIDLTGSGDNRLMLSVASVLAISDTGTLLVTGDAGDRLDFNDHGWALGASAGGLTSYTNGAATLLVADGVAVASSFAVSALAASLAEGDSGTTPFTFTITRDGNTAGTGSVDWLVVGLSANPATAGDFASPLSGTVSFAAGQTSAILTIAVAGDTRAEPDEGFQLLLRSPQGGGIARASATGSILNDDISFGIAATEATKAERDGGSTPFVFTVTRAGATTGTDSVAWFASGLPGGAGVADFAAGSPLSGRVTFATGETSRTITLMVAGDASVEPDEAFRVMLTAPSAGTTGGGAVGLILNDDSGFVIATDTPRLAEGNAGVTDFTFTITRQGIATGSASVAWSTIGVATASANPHDFVGGIAPSGIANFAAGEVSQTVTVKVQGDTTTEPDEAFRVVLGRPSAGHVIITGSATATIDNDDTGYSIAAATPSLAEGDSGATAFTFTISRTGDASTAGNVAWTTSGVSSAATGLASVELGDFTGRHAPSGVASFAAGQVSQTVTVNIAGDTLVEPDEWFTVRLSAPSGGASLLASAALARVVNDDAGFRIDAVSAVKQEGNSGPTPYSFAIARSGDTSGTNSVGWFLSGLPGASALLSDFSGPIAGTLSFAPGQTTANLTIEARGDTAIEPDENFIVRLHSPGSGVILASTAAGMILNDDGIVPPGIFASALTGIAAGDFNGDGIIDQLRQTGDGALYLINGKTSHMAALPTAIGMQFLGTGDFNHDGCADLLLRDQAGGLRAWLMRGAEVLHDDLLVTPSPLARAEVGTDSTGSAILLHDPAAVRPYALFHIASDNTVATTPLDTPPPGWHA